MFEKYFFKLLLLVKHWFFWLYFLKSNSSVCLLISLTNTIKENWLYLLSFPLQTGKGKNKLYSAKNSGYSCQSPFSELRQKQQQKRNHCNAFFSSASKLMNCSNWNKVVIWKDRWLSLLFTFSSSTTLQAKQTLK